MTTDLPLWIDVRLMAIERIARDINLYRFERPNGEALPRWTAGAHVDLELTTSLIRQYSLIGHGEDMGSYQIAAKLDAASRGGSRLLHDGVRVGALYRISVPRNNFPLAEDAAHTVLVAGGIGITPILSMANRLAAIGRPYTLVYACRAREDAAFAAELSSEHGATLHYDDESGGPLDLALLDSQPTGTHVYCCGPAGMIDAFERRAAGLFPPEQIHVEYFSAREEPATDGGFSIRLARDGRSFAIPPGTSILSVLLEAGIDLPHSCRQGVCGSCETRVLDGIVDHRDAILSPAERAEGSTMMICCSGAKSSRLVLDL